MFERLMTDPDFDKNKCSIHVVGNHIVPGTNQTAVRLEIICIGTETFVNRPITYPLPNSLQAGVGDSFSLIE